MAYNGSARLHLMISFGRVFFILIFYQRFRSSTSACQSEWSTAGDFCYFKVTNLTASSPNYVDAYQGCVNLYGNLPTFRDVRDWHDCLAYANSTAGFPAYPFPLGYLKYNATVYPSIYDGQTPNYTNWDVGEPNDTIGFSVFVQPTGNAWFADSYAYNPSTVICQQDQLYDTSKLNVSCTSVCRSYNTNAGHRFTVDPYWCPSGMTVEMNSIGYAPTRHAPNLTEVIYEMQNPTNGMQLMAFGGSGRTAVEPLGYTGLLRVLYVLMKPNDYTSPFFLLWNSVSPTDSLISPVNSEYNGLISAGWITAASFYMYSSQYADGLCLLARNCTYNSWQAWSACSVSCGNGSISRSRTINVTESNGGECDSVLNETDYCNLSDCPTNCTWNDWQPWSACSLSCGNGTKERSRSKNISEANGGVCDNVSNETGICNTAPCPIDCVWNEWTDWSNCSVDCGGGITEMSRNKNVSNAYGGYCDNVYVRTNSCNSQLCPVDCLLTKWTSFGPCSVTCGDNEGVRKRSRSIVTQSLHGGTPCPSSLTEIANCTSIEKCKVDPLNAVWRMVATVVQSIGCGVTIATLTALLVLFFAFRISSFERTLHTCQEVALLATHFLICFFAFRQQADAFSKHACLFVAIGLQYFYAAYYTFLTLECLHFYCVLTNVVMKDEASLFPKWQNLAFGWIVPALVTAATTAAYYPQYVSENSCWTNWGAQPASASFILPILISLSVASILCEASGLHGSHAWPTSDRRRRAAARISRHSMTILIPLHLVFWLFSSNAIYYQNVALYTTVFGLNVTFAVAIFVFHVAANDRVHEFVKKKVFNRFKREKKVL